jgi:hypothetical protein
MDKNKWNWKGLRTLVQVAVVGTAASLVGAVSEWWDAQPGTAAYLSIGAALLSALQNFLEDQRAENGSDL